jgi:hypothetical protein
MHLSVPSPVASSSYQGVWVVVGNVCFCSNTKRSLDLRGDPQGTLPEQRRGVGIDKKVYGCGCGCGDGEG